MAEVNNRTLRLTAVELRDMTGWPDPMIEEFLSLLDNLSSLIQSNNEISGEVETADELNARAAAEIGHIRGRLAKMAKGLADVEAMVAQASAMALQAIKKAGGGDVTAAQVAGRIFAGL